VFGRDPDEALARFDRLRQRVGEPGGDVRFGVSPHAPYTCSLDVYDACASLALPLGTHLAESGAEREWLVHGAGPMAELAELFVPPTGETAIRSLAGRGLLRPGLLAAHCVDVDDEEIALLAEGGVGVAHCPRSNAMLGCGIAPLATLRAATARVGLGTDSPASTPSLDPFAELRAAVLGARARERRPDALSAADALELATLGSARALGIDGEVGSIRVGKRADLAILSFAGTGWLPWDDPVTAVVLGGRPERVVGTLVDGHPRYERGRTAWHGLTDAARSARSRMLP
jgi:5-methylthioadenosine/S-adenosylhomocysteine deaminase